MPIQNLFPLIFEHGHFPGLSYLPGLGLHRGVPLVRNMGPERYQGNDFIRYFGVEF